MQKSADLHDSSHRIVSSLKYFFVCERLQISKQKCYQRINSMTALSYDKYKSTSQKRQEITPQNNLVTASTEVQYQNYWRLQELISTSFRK